MKITVRENSLYVICVNLILLTLCCIICGCLSFKNTTKQEASNSSSSSSTSSHSESFRDSNFKTKTSGVSELDIARLQAQIEELKQTVKKQKETISVLEKSLVLGISPELYMDQQETLYNQDDPMNLLSDQESEFEAGSGTESESKSESESEESNFKLKEGSDFSNLNPELEKNTKDLETRVRYAKELYESGSYGQAIVEYSDILKNYPQKIEYRYWVGSCWYKLKEYNLATKILQKYINDDPSSTLVPQAKLIVANSWLEQGYFDKAIKEYKAIIQSYPKDPVSKIAKQQILNAGKNL